MAARVAPAESGWRVRLFEQSPFLPRPAPSSHVPQRLPRHKCPPLSPRCWSNLIQLSPRRRHQTKGAIERFWRVVLVSALDEELEKTDARYGIDVFWKAFLSNRTGYRMGVPTVPLAELYDGCKSAIEQMGGEVNLRAAARQLQIENGAVTTALFDAGREERADAFILAVPHTAVAALFPDETIRKGSVFPHLTMLKSAPITGVHLWLDREVMTEPFITLLDTTTQWIFIKTAFSHALTGPPKPPAN